MKPRSLLSALALIALSACTPESSPRKAAPKDESEVVTNRILIPPTVRENLGITFITVERRRVAKTLRVPGHFEHQATARTEYRSPVAARLELLVRQYADVDAGQALYRLDAPEWRRLQQELAEAELSGASVERRLSAAQDRAAAIREQIDLLNKRIEQLQKLNKAGGGRAAEIAEAQGRLAQAKTDLASSEELSAQSDIENLRLKGRQRSPRFEQALRAAASLMELTEDQLLEPAGPDGAPRWKTLKQIEVAARNHSHIEEIGATTGQWVKEGDLLLAAVDHQALLFRARGLQSDLGILRDGLKARIAPPQGGSLQLQDTVPGELRIGIDADPHERTIDLLIYPSELKPWARPGVSAFAEVVLDEAEAEQPAIPLSCVVTDGLDKVYFMRDRGDKDKAVRVVADLGVDDGRWVEVRSGLKAGDEVVLDGAYELKLTGSGKTSEGGHFHSDGTFHEAHD